nr:F241 [uncultured bacterium]ART39737.1 J246 [uncultured bacterium]
MEHIVYFDYLLKNYQVFSFEENLTFCRYFVANLTSVYKKIYFEVRL